MEVLVRILKLKMFYCFRPDMYCHKGYGEVNLRCRNCNFQATFYNMGRIYSDQEDRLALQGADAHTVHYHDRLYLNENI